MDQMMEKHIARLDSVPVYQLDEKHIQNARVIISREKMLELLPSGRIVAELGVDEGGFSEQILKKNKPSKLHLVDAWGSERYGEPKRKAVFEKYKAELESGQVVINHGLSNEVVTEFPDKYFDWIYIDTSHSYTGTIEELNLYESKIKDGGIIAGHDFVIGNWRNQLKYGVIEAVYEFCLKKNWELIYITAENRKHPSFAIKKIGN